MQERFEAVLEYEARLNRRDAAEASARPDSALRDLQLQAESRGVLFGAEHPEAAAEAFVARVQAELRNRRKVSALVPELASAEMESAFSGAVAGRIAEGADILRRQIECRHYRTGPTPPPDVVPRNGAELIAAHEAAVNAQRRNDAPSYERMFPNQGPPDLSPVERFRVRAHAVFPIIETEFGLMRLRAERHTSDPNQSGGFQHVPVHLSAAVRTLATDVDALRKGWPEAAALANALQSLAGTIVRAGELPDGHRLEAVRLVQQFLEALLPPERFGHPLELNAAARALRVADSVITRSQALIPAWSRFATEFARLCGG